MTEDEFDMAVGCRIRNCVEECRLPDDFADRLVRTARRAERARRIWCSALIAVLAAACLLLFGFGRPARESSRTKDTLVSSSPAQDASHVTGWMVLGCIRECLRRVRTGKRKDEDGVADPPRE